MDRLNPGLDEMQGAGWDEAFDRVECYLRYLGITHRPVLHRRVEAIVEAARQRVAAGDKRPPGAVSGEVLLESLVTWFRAVLELDTGIPDAEVLHRGQLTLAIAQLPPERQQRILSRREPDPELLSEMRRAYALTAPAAGRELLTPRALDFGPLPKLADLTLTGLDRTPRFRALLLWSLAIAFFGALFYWTR